MSKRDYTDLIHECFLVVKKHPAILLREARGIGYRDEAIRAFVLRRMNEASVVGSEETRCGTRIRLAICSFFRSTDAELVLTWAKNNDGSAKLAPDGIKRLVFLEEIRLFQR